MAIELPVVEVVYSALAVKDGVIGLLVGLLGRELFSYLRSLSKVLRGSSS